jgi:hypothetical protein
MGFNHVYLSDGAEGADRLDNCFLTSCATLPSDTACRTASPVDEAKLLDQLRS